MRKGFIYCLLLSGERAGSMLSFEELQAWTPEQGLLWVHLNYEETHAREWLYGQTLPRLEIDALLTRDTRPRAIVTEQGMLLALRGVNLNPDADPEDMVALRLLASETRIISTSRRSLHSVKELADKIMLRHGPKTTGEFILEICDRLTLRKTEFIAKLDDKMDELEELLVSGGKQDLRSDIAELRRQTVALRRYLAPQREAFAAMQTDEDTLLNHHEQMRLREIRDRLVRAIEDLEAIRDRANVTQEELLSRQSEELNQRLYFLSLVTAVFLPLGFLTGLLGVNIGGIPGANTDWAFAAFCGLLILLVAVQLLLFYRKRWL
ncbi:zinc transporter ZntB [Shewanella cyperi]|uniref:Zinc transporter ZntB n=1 Tax=Shewanella cyperi TaxID=2814292 RepID=A0A975AJM1_9GAMM|nr:zinc transporter ZntB [Shewanella cyperi]QSX29442.1 zinc transporter ZntB [Shewanella cyperi]